MQLLYNSIWSRLKEPSATRLSESSNLGEREREVLIGDVCGTLCERQSNIQSVPTSLKDTEKEGEKINNVLYCWRNGRCASLPTAGRSPPPLPISIASAIQIKQPGFLINELCDAFCQQTLLIPSTLIQTARTWRWESFQLTELPTMSWAVSLFSPSLSVS